MSIKLVGAFLVVAGGTGFGLSMALCHRREERNLRQYILALDLMESELSFRLSPLPELCRSAASVTTGAVQQFFLCLALELDAQIAPDVCCCIRSALAKTPGLSPALSAHLEDLGQCMGRFDLSGQLRGLRSAATRATRSLEELTANRDIRLRSYQTLGLCAGAALAILFL